MAIDLEQYFLGNIVKHLFNFKNVNKNDCKNTFVYNKNDWLNATCVKTGCNFE